MKWGWKIICTGAATTDIADYIKDWVKKNRSF
jgi:hypothetical protein